jgi:diguanylate cyclase (GGDEF)-like protein
MQPREWLLTMTKEVGTHARAPDAGAAQAPAPASGNASDQLKEVRDLRRRVQIGVYSAVLGLQLINYFVLGLTTLQISVSVVAGFGITIAAVEGAFVRGLQLRKRSAYPRVLLAELGAVYTVSEAAPLTLAVLHRLLGLRASFITIGRDADNVSLGSVRGMSRECAERFLRSGMPKVREAMRTKQVARLDPSSALSEGMASLHEDVALIPMQALHETMGVLAVAGDKGNRDLKDGQLLSGIGTALGLSLEYLRQKETILHLAYHDALTDLPNRTLFEDRLTVALAQARRKRQMAAVMFLDLDRFKVVNDTVGHAMGDLLLKSVAERLTNLVREGDTVARVGGDEFTLLLPEVARAEDVVEIAERVLDSLRQPWLLDGHEFRVTASIGVAICPTDGEDADSMLTNADTAMYRAKDRGRDSYEFWTPAMATSKTSETDDRSSHALRTAPADP